MNLTVDELRRIVNWFDVAANEGEIDRADADLADRIASAIESTETVE